MSLSDRLLREILKSIKTIAMVGLIYMRLDPVILLEDISINAVTKSFQLTRDTEEKSSLAN